MTARCYVSVHSVSHMSRLCQRRQKAETQSLPCSTRCPQVQSLGNMFSWSRESVFFENVVCGLVWTASPSGRVCIFPQSWLKRPVIRLNGNKQNTQPVGPVQPKVPRGGFCPLLLSAGELRKRLWGPGRFVCTDFTICMFSFFFFSAFTSMTSTHSSVGWRWIPLTSSRLLLKTKARSPRRRSYWSRDVFSFKSKWDMWKKNKTKQRVCFKVMVHRRVHEQLDVCPSQVQPLKDVKEKSVGQWMFSFFLFHAEKCQKCKDYVNCKLKRVLYGSFCFERAWDQTRGERVPHRVASEREPIEERKRLKNYC